MSKLIGVRIVHKPHSSVPHHLQFLYSSGGRIGMEYDPLTDQVFELPCSDVSAEETEMLENFRKEIEEDDK